MKLIMDYKLAQRATGPIKYFVEYQPERSITFQFDLPGFNGFHRFDINELEPDKTELSG